jgi:hypothetical protein
MVYAVDVRELTSALMTMPAFDFSKFMDDLRLCVPILDVELGGSPCVLVDSIEGFLPS